MKQNIYNKRANGNTLPTLTSGKNSPKTETNIRITWKIISNAYFPLCPKYDSDCHKAFLKTFAAFIPSDFHRRKVNTDVPHFHW